MPISRWRLTTAYASIACRPDSSSPLAINPSSPSAATAARYGNKGSAVSLLRPVADDRIGSAGIDAVDHLRADPQAVTAPPVRAAHDQHRRG